MSAAANKAIVRDYFAKMVSGDTRLPDLLADDVRWFAPPSGELGGMYDGKEAVLGLMSQGVGLYDADVPMVLDIEQMVAEDDWVCVQLVLEAKTAKGEDYRNHYHFAFQLRGGKLTYVKEYLDTQYAHEKLFSS